jgi:hypothetical protein
MKRGSVGYLDEVADATAEALIAELAKGGS